MKRIWLILNAVAVGVIYAAPRELTSEELITKPRPGEEYVNIQTQSSNATVNLKDQSFITSHHIPQLTKTDFQTAHKIPSDAKRPSRSLKISSNSDLNRAPYFNTETKVSFSIVEGTTNQPPLERVVTRTSIKMTKSKKVQKTAKTAHDDIIDIKANEGFIDEKSHADAEEQEIMKKKFLKNEKVEDRSEVFLLPTKFNVPFEDDVKEINYDKKQVLLPYPVLFTTQEPPITTFNYKNVYEKMKKNKSPITLIPEKEAKTQEKFKYDSYNQEYIKTAETKSIDEKKYAKHEKKDIQRKDEIHDKEESGFFLLPVNKEKHVEDNVDFVDFDDKILVPAGSSPSQSSRINIKKGPNGQEYEYEYVYYYYDEDEDDGGNKGSAVKEGKVVSSTTEKVYNGHDGPPKEDQKQNFLAKTSTSGSKYLPTESTKPFLKNRKKIQADVENNEGLAQSVPEKTFKGGNSGRFTPASKQPEPSNNEVLPSSGRSGFRPRGKSTTTTTEEIPSIGEERLPPNTRFPPRFRPNNGPATSPQPQEITSKARSREGSNQSRFRIPNSSLLDSSSFRTHASDASVEEDVNRDLEYQRRGSTRGQNSEATHRRGTKPTAASLPETSEIPAVTRRPAIRRPIEERRSKIKPVEQEIGEDELQKRPTISTEESNKTLRVPTEEYFIRPQIPPEEEQKQEVPLEQQQAFKEPLEEQHRLKVPLEEQQRPQVPLEEQQRPRVPLDEQQKSTPSLENLQPGVPVEKQQNLTNLTAPKVEESSVGNQQVQGNLGEIQEVERRPETTRESDAEEGIFEGQKSQIAPDQNTNPSPNLEARPLESTTEDQSAIGLTSTMMEKVALDLYAILQQTQNENIRTNFVDGNATDVRLGFGEGPTEFPTFGDVSPAEPSSTTATTTTTTTTTPLPPTTTTTIAPAQAQAPGKGRYRGRVATGAKGRAKVTTATTETAEVVTSPKTRGRFHPNQGTRGSSNAFSRPKASKPVPKETSQEVSPVDQTSKPAADKSFGERPRNRFRVSGKVTTSPSTAPSTISTSPSPTNGRKGNSVDRFNSRRRGNARGSLNLPQTQQQKVEGVADEEKHELHQENSVPTEETIPSSTLRPTRQRIGGAIRPLRPGPRAPLNLPQRGQTSATTGTTQLPTAHEEIAKEVSEQDAQVQYHSEEPQEPSTTQAGDALSRLKSRPRLRIGPNNSNQKLQTPVAPPPGSRRKLVSSLLPKRKPNEEKPVEKAEEVEEKALQEAPIEEEQIAVQTETPSTPAEPEPKGLSGLLAGRRRNLNRRPGTIYTKAQAQAHPAEA